MNSAVPEDSSLYNFDIDHIERMIADNDWSGCWAYLGKIIENMTQNANTYSILLSAQLQKDMEDEHKKLYINQWGSLLGELFLFLLTNEGTSLSDQSFESLIYYHETLHTLFYICDIKNTDELVLNMLGDGKKKLAAATQKKILLLLSLDTTLDVNKILESIDTKYRVSAYAAYSIYRKIFRENVYNNKVKLYAIRHEIEKTYLQPTALVQAAVAYFMCSYLNIPDKHKLKENINTAFRYMIRDRSKLTKNIRNMPAEQDNLILDKNLPTVLILTEMFSRKHAMYRCWGQRANSIQNNFNVVFMISADMADYSLKSEYKNFLTFNTLGQFYKAINDVKPDVIFMPSLGMKFFNIVVANQRLAPIQIMGLGHPASSMSEYIDYVIGQEGLYDEKAFPKDRYITDGFPRTFIPLLTKQEFFAPLDDKDMPEKEEPKKTIRIGVVGTNMKVSYPFFKLLKEIVSESPFDIHVSFIFAVGGMDSFYIEKYLKENFKNSTYYGWQPYDLYIKSLKTVDVVVNPFPFGHTNTIIDALMCGKPCIGLDGIEPSSKTEGYVLDAVGLRDQFIAKDEAEYKQKFFAICDRILKGDTNFFDRDKIYDQLFTEHLTTENDYGKIIKWIYDNNDKLKASGKKYFEAFEEV